MPWHLIVPYPQQAQCRIKSSLQICLTVNDSEYGLKRQMPLFKETREISNNLSVLVINTFVQLSHSTVISLSIFVCIYHWYFTMSNIFIINNTLSSEFWIYMFMWVWRICRRLQVALWAVSVTTREAPAAMRSLLWRRYSQCLINLARH